MDVEMQDASVAEDQPAQLAGGQSAGFQDRQRAERQGSVSMYHSEGDEMYMGDNELASSFQRLHTQKQRCLMPFRENLTMRIFGICDGSLSISTALRIQIRGRWEEREIKNTENIMTPLSLREEKFYFELRCSQNETYVVVSERAPFARQMYNYTATDSRIT